MEPTVDSPKPVRRWVLWIGTTLCILLALLILIGFLADPTPGSTQTGHQETTPSSESSEKRDSLGRILPATVTNDAELLLFRCGRPSSDQSSEYEDPRPPIPTRLIKYKKSGLMFVYSPGKGTKLFDPPPYRWTLLGITDLRTNKMVAAGTLKATIQKRLPCFLGPSS